MRPVHKGSWPLDPKTNSPKVFQSNRNKKDDTSYQKAKSDLIERLGCYCSYCEDYLDDRYLHVEHMLPKSLHSSLRGDWNNFLLACGPCNESKLAKDIDLDDYYWPDRHNTASLFEYQESGKVFVNLNLNDSQKQKAQRTLKLTGLDRYPGGVEIPRPGDRRWIKRREDWNKANLSRQLLKKNDTPEMRDYIVIQAKEGFFSVWMTVFRDDSDMLKRFIEAFPGTRKDYFDDRGRPLPIINFENQPSTDSSIKERYRETKSLVNPSLRETPIHEPADVIPSQQQESLLDWLKRTGRLIARDTLEPIEGYKPEEEEISELIVDDSSDDYDDDERIKE